jgi:hypothetical protein
MKKQPFARLLAHPDSLVLAVSLISLALSVGSTLLG